MTTLDISFADPAAHPALAEVLRCQLTVWPEHEIFLRRRLAVDGLAVADHIAHLIQRLAGDRLAEVCADYRWTCARMLEEQLHFRRTGRYRLSTFEEAEREVYADQAYMARYMNGLLLSQLWWSNHTSAIQYYFEEFLPGNPDAYRHLEIGPGHGLLLYFAAQDARASRVAGWDLSPASVEATRHALDRLVTHRCPELRVQDLLEAPARPELFDSVVLSEVCEHLEDPRAALVSLRGLLSPRGRVFVNIPVNSPAADHIYLLRTPEEVVDLVASAGYAIEATRFFPVTGYTEKQARAANLTISCAVIATRGSS